MIRFMPKQRAMYCKDCDAVTISPRPIKDGWLWINLVEGADVCNGWRCPSCVAGWEEIEIAAVSDQTFH
jgi:hypothetical protein